MSKSLPLVNLSLLRPVVTALRDNGLDPETVLETCGLTEDAVASDGATVHVMVVHQFLETCAQAVDDATFCASVAARLDPSGWPMIESALSAGGSLAEFLSTYVSRANEVASSVTAYLELRGDQAVFGENRLFRPTIVPAQNDGFMVSLALTILRRALGARLAPRQVMLVLCDPAVLPESFSEFRRLKGDEMGFRIKFPSSWLAFPVDPQAKEPIDAWNAEAPGVSRFLAEFRGLIAGQIDQGGLDASSASTLVSMSRATLARRLATEGTTISSEIRRAKSDFARQSLRRRDLSVEEIAAALGYADPSNFTRAFRNVEGVSPSTFRNQARTAD